MRSIIKLGGAGLALVLLVLASAPNANATAVYGTPADLTGSRSFPVDINGHGLDSTCGGGSNCITQLTVSWTITFDSGTQLWTYSYTVTYNPPQGNTNDIIIDTNAGSLGSTCSSDANCLVPVSASISSATFGTYSATNSQPPGNLPGLQNSITGFDLHISANQSSGTTYSFTSDRAPAWSDFDISLAGGNRNFFNTGNEGSNHANSMSTLDFLPGPSAPTPAPEPATWASIGLGLIALGAGSRFRKQRTKS